MMKLFLALSKFHNMLMPLNCTFLIIIGISHTFNLYITFFKLYMYSHSSNKFKGVLLWNLVKFLKML